MRTVGGMEFPTCREDFERWRAEIHYRVLARDMLLIARTRVEGRWRCYAVTVAGQNHDIEASTAWQRGTAVTEAIARAAFPRFAHLPYAS